MRRERARAYVICRRSSSARSDALDILVATLESGVCDEAAARQLYTLGRDAVTLALLAAARRIANQNACIADRNAHIAQLQTRLATGRDPTAVTSCVWRPRERASRPSISPRKC